MSVLIASKTRWEVPKERLRIARRFNAGFVSKNLSSSEGTVDALAIIRSAVPSGLVISRDKPGVKTPGYYRKSLRDWKMGRRTKMKTNF